MRKLTKIIKKRNKVYKPTIGIENKFGTKFSVNANTFYIELQKKREREFEAKIRRMFMKKLSEVAPNFVSMINYFGSSYLNNWSMY